jgi:hypothetical protein
MARTNGTRISRPEHGPAPWTTEQVLAVVQHVADDTDRLSVTVTTRNPIRSWS